MRRVLHWVAIIIGVLGILAALVWVAIGPQWRTFLMNPPSDTDVLFWTQSQRDSGFGLSDRLPMVKTLGIPASDRPSALPEGAPLEMDVNAYMQAQNAAAVLVLHKGQIRLERYGLHQTPKSRWTSFSVAKSITSTLVGAAIADGHIRSMEDKVSDYVTGLEGSAYDDVSIRQLLTMTSGVDWDEDYQDPASDVARFRTVEAVAGEPAIVTYLKRLGRAAPPGTRFNYSTGETNLVGVLVEAATGQSLTDYLSAKIWGPYGMEGKASWVVSKTGEPISGCCLQATARDYARFGQFILEGAVIDGTAILPDGWLAEATTTQQANPDDATRDYGFQWWTLSDGAFAAMGIFGQGIFIDPKREIVLVTHSSWSDARGVAEGQATARLDFFDALRRAVDAEP